MTVATISFTLLSKITLELVLSWLKFDQGLGTKLITAFIKKRPNVDEWLIDPEACNLRAIHCYKKVGFKEIEAFTPHFNPHPHIMMRFII